MTKKTSIIVLLCGLFVFAAQYLSAEVPNRITYQGRLHKSNVGAYGEHIFVARILAADGTQLWSSGNIKLSLPATGDFSLVLEPTGIDWLNQSPKLEISVDGEKLSPNDQFSSSPYALVAAKADTVSDGAITTSKIADSAITTEKITNGSVTTAKMSNVIGLAIDSTRIQLKDSDQFLSIWQSTDTSNRHKIRAGMIDGPVSNTAAHKDTHRPVSAGGTGGDEIQIVPFQVDGTAIVASTSSAQIIQPTDNNTPLVVRNHAGDALSDVLSVQLHDNTAAFIVKGDGQAKTRDIIPNQDSTRNLGATGTEWANIYADTITVNGYIRGGTVAALYKTEAVCRTSDSSSPIQFNTKLFDTHNAATTGAAWKFTVPVGGIYSVSVTIGSDTSTFVNLYRNGVMHVVIIGTEPTYSSGSVLVQLVAGDYVDVRFENSATYYCNARQQISIHRIGD